MLIRQLNNHEAIALQHLRISVDVAGTLGRPAERQSALTMEFIEQQLQSPFETIGTFFGEKLIGSASLSRMPECTFDTEAAEWFGLSSVIVHPDFRGRGVGRGLMNECIRRAREQGAKGILLVVNIPNPEAQALYESLGFRIWNTEEGAYQHNGQRIDRLSMKKQLEAP